jgi:hypothetical protein
MDLANLFDLHSGFRWIVVLLGIVAAIRMIVGLVAHQPYDKSAKMLMRLYSTAFDIQVLIGLIYFIWSGTKYDIWPRYRWEHATGMIIGLIILHLAVRWRKAVDSIRYRNDLAVIVVSLFMVYTAVVLLPMGMERWF